jgi:hypothetical protein
MYSSPEQVRAKVEKSGTGRAVYGFTTVQVSERELQEPSPADWMDETWKKVRELYAGNGVLEVGDVSGTVGD